MSGGGFLEDVQNETAKLCTRGEWNAFISGMQFACAWQPDYDQRDVVAALRDAFINGIEMGEL